MQEIAWCWHEYRRKQQLVAAGNKLAFSLSLRGCVAEVALHLETLLGCLCTLQAPIDFNQYLGIQRAGIVCLQLPQQRLREYAAVWRRRAEALVPVLRRCGWQLPEPKACRSWRLMADT